MRISKRLSVLCGLIFAMSVGCGGAAYKQASSGGYAQTPAGTSREAYPGSPASPMDASPSRAEASSQLAPAAPPPMAAGESTASTTPPPPAAAPMKSGTASRDVQAPSPAPTPRQRPGLGTEWGETRASYVHDVAFTRQDPDRPFAVATMNYNDRAGVDALARSHVDRFHDMSAAGGAISVEIHNAAGEPLDAVHVGERTYVIGREGERYTIVLTNHTDHRFEAVTTVDGLDVINGRAGKMSNRGYLLMPYSTVEIDGFRQSSDAVAAFRFSRVSDSYAAQTGSARNVGVIGVAFFSERGDSFVAYDANEIRTRETASPFPGQDPRYARPPHRGF